MTVSALKMFALLTIYGSGILAQAASLRIPIEARWGFRLQGSGGARRFPITQQQSLVASPQKVPAGHTDGGWYHTVNITVGTPPQKLRATFDISQIDTTILSTRCLEADFAYCDNMADHLYNETLSETVVQLNKSASQRYAALIFDGRQVQDTIVVDDITLNEQAFNSVSDVHPQGFLALWRGDAILGLGPGIDLGYDGLRKPGVMQNMIERGLLKKDLIGLKLAQQEGDVGEIRLGEIDPDYQHRLVSLPVSDARGGGLDLGPWHVSAHSMQLKFDDGCIHYEDLSGFHAVFHTQDPLIFLPNAITERILERLRVDGGLNYIDCKYRESGPSLTFFLGPFKVPFTLKPSDYIYQTNYQGYCWVPIGGESLDHAGPDGSGLIFLGPAFLGAFYSVFDADRSTISLAYL